MASTIEQRERFRRSGAEARRYFDKDYDRVFHVLVAMQSEKLGKIYRGNLATVTRQIILALDDFGIYEQTHSEEE